MAGLAVIAFLASGVSADSNWRKGATVTLPVFLSLLACGLAVLCYIAWRFNFPK